jgi:hypothetical protein
MAGLSPHNTESTIRHGAPLQLHVFIASYNDVSFSSSRNHAFCVVFCPRVLLVQCILTRETYHALSTLGVHAPREALNSSIGWKSLKKSSVKRSVREPVCFLMCFQKNPGGKSCHLSKKNQLNMYKRHQIVIDELEIRSIGTDFSRQTSWWAREDPGRART